jgi:hypothetical protein
LTASARATTALNGVSKWLCPAVGAAKACGMNMGMAIATDRAPRARMVFADSFIALIS